MKQGHETGGLKRFWRYACVGLLAFVLFASPRQAHAGGFCDTCVVGAIEILQADLDVLLGDIDLTLSFILVDTDWIVAEEAIMDPAILVALYGPVPGPGIDYDVQQGFADVIEAIDTHATESAPMHAQVGADATKYYLDAHGMADESVRAYVSPNSMHCATTYVMALGNQLELFTHALAQATMKMIRDRDTGPAATTGGGVQGQSVCESVAPFANVNRYGSNVYNALINGCQNSNQGQAPAQLQEASLDIGMLFDRVQFLIPSQTPTTTKNNHIIFNPQSNDEWWYVAAWRLCENFVPNAPPPPNGSNSNNVATLNDLTRAGADARSAVYKMPVLRECMQALADRTACTQNGSGNGNPQVPISGIGNVDCWQMQNIACHRLKDPLPSGLAIQDVHNEEVNAALANCDNNGLSYKAYMYAWSHRCSDPTFMSQAVPQEYADNSRSRAELALCDDSLRLYEHLFGEDARTNFYEAIDLFLMGPGGGQSNPAGQAIYNTSSLYGDRLTARFLAN